MATALTSASLALLSKNGEVGGFGSRNFKNLIKGKVLGDTAVRREGVDFRRGRLLVSSVLGRRAKTTVRETICSGPRLSNPNSIARSRWWIGLCK